MSEHDGTGRRPGSGWDGEDELFQQLEDDLAVTGAGADDTTGADVAGDLDDSDSRSRGARVVRMPWQRRPHVFGDGRSDIEDGHGSDMSADMGPDSASSVSGQVVPLRPDGRARIDSAMSTDSAPDDDTPDDDTPDGADTSDGPDGVVRVDSPGEERVRWSDVVQRGQRRPVLPEWVKSREAFTAAARWLVTHSAHVTAFHGVRLPVYAGRVAVRAPRGGVRAVGAVGRWVWDVEGLPVRLATVRRDDAEIYLKLSRQRDARVRTRSVLTLLALAGALAVLGAWWWLLPAWTHPAAAVAVVVALGLAGGVQDQPLVGPAVVAPKATRLTSDIVVRALASLGLAEINRAVAKAGTRGITFPAPITRDGPGWRADVDLPFGVTVTDIIERRDRLASGLRRPLGCVWPEPAHHEHAGRLVLWVGDEDMATARPAPWPLAKHGTVDLFAPVPFGTDQRGRGVRVPLMYSNVLIGAMPGYGKTFALRVLLLAAALDVRAQLRVFELKGSGDLAPLAKVAHGYASGVDETTIETVMAHLREVHADLAKRAATIAGLPRDLAPENKVTPPLAGRRHLGLFPLVLAIDECQELFTHPLHGKEAADLCTAIIKRGRALGVILLLATQRPDKDSLPTGVSSNVGVRYAMRVMGQVENDMILGTSAYRNGVRATVFTARDLGIGYLLGAGPDPQITRAAYLDAPAAEKVTLRARAARAAAGTLTGHAAGQDDIAASAARPATTLLDDILTVVPAGEDRVWSEIVVARLGDLAPDTYAGWNVEQLAAALKPYGIETAQIGRRVDGKTINRRGIDRAHITTAIAERDRRRPSP